MTRKGSDLGGRAGEQGDTVSASRAADELARAGEVAARKGLAEAAEAVEAVDLAAEVRRYRRYPAYRDSGVEWLGEVPEHWEVKPLKHALEQGKADGSLIKGKMSQQPEAGLHVAFSASGQDIWVEEAQNEGPGLVLSAVGARCGKTFKADGKWTAVANTHVFLPRGRFERNFLWYLTNQESFWERGGTAQPFVRVAATLQRAWCFPPADEQIDIAAFLDRETARIDGLIAKKERLIELLQEKRTALITHAVTKGLDPTVPMKDSGVEWLGEIPAHWEVARLKDLVPGLTVGIVVTPSKYYVSEGVPCLRSLNIAQGSIDLNNLVFIADWANQLHRKSQIFNGDLLVVRTGKAGAAVVVPPSLDGANCIDLLIIRRSSLLESRFLFHFINSAATSGQVQAHSVGAIQEHYNTGTLAELRVPRLPLECQRDIAAFLDRESTKLDALVAKVREAIDRLKELRTALISAAVTGKIDVRKEIR